MRFEGRAVSRDRRRARSWRERHGGYVPAAENILSFLCAGWLSEDMPRRQEAPFLRERARRLREIASAHRTALSQQLRAMAAELYARADELEQSRRAD